MHKLLHHFSLIEMHERENLSHNFFSLVMGSSLDVWSYNECIVGGMKFHMVERDSQ